MARLAWAWQRLSESGTQLLRFARTQTALRREAAVAHAHDVGVDDCSSVELDELAVPEFDPRFGADTFIH